MYFKIILENNHYYLTYGNIKLTYLSINFINSFKKLKSKRIYFVRNVLGEYKIFFVNKPMKIVVHTKTSYYYDYDSTYIDGLDSNDLKNLKITFNNKLSLKEKEIDSIFKFKNSTIREFNIYLL